MVNLTELDAAKQLPWFKWNG